MNEREKIRTNKAKPQAEAEKIVDGTISEIREKTAGDTCRSLTGGQENGVVGRPQGEAQGRPVPQAFQSRPQGEGQGRPFPQAFQSRPQGEAQGRPFPQAFQSRPQGEGQGQAPASTTSATSPTQAPASTTSPASPAQTPTQTPASPASEQPAPRLFDELREKFNARQSDDPRTPDRIIVDSFEIKEDPNSPALTDLDEFLKKRGAQIIAPATPAASPASPNTTLRAIIDGKEYEFYSKSEEQYERSRYDGIVDHNLTELEKSLPPNPKVLYIGSYGDMRIKDKFPDAVNLDITADMLDANDVKGSAYSLPFHEGTFDLVFFKDMENSVITSPRVAREVGRILKKGGYMFSTGTFEMWGKEGKITDPKRTLERRYEKIKEIYPKEGFELVEKQNFKHPEGIAVLKKSN